MRTGGKGLESLLPLFFFLFPLFVQATDYAIFMRDEEGTMYFDPASLIVEPGDRVAWFNMSGLHDVTAYHPKFQGKPLRIPEGAEPWSSGILGILNRGFTHSYTFQKAGLYDYRCAAHEFFGMVGRVLVGKVGDGPATKPFEDSISVEAQKTFPSLERIQQGAAMDRFLARASLAVIYIFDEKPKRARKLAKQLLREYDSGGELKELLSKKKIEKAFREKLIAYEKATRTMGTYEAILEARDAIRDFFERSLTEDFPPQAVKKAKAD